MQGASSIAAKASRPPTQPESVSMAVTVALRGASRSSAISPTIMPGPTSTTLTSPPSPTCSTLALPEPINRKETACSPWRSRTSPGAAFSVRRWTASGPSDSTEQPAKNSRPASFSALTAVDPATPRGYGVAPGTGNHPGRQINEDYPAERLAGKSLLLLGQGRGALDAGLRHGDRRCTGRGGRSDGHTGAHLSGHGTRIGRSLQDCPRQGGPGDRNSCADDGERLDASSTHGRNSLPSLNHYSC